jgi:hypothetical protein
LRPIARATDSPRDVWPDQGQDEPVAPAPGAARLGVDLALEAQLADGQVLDDPLLDVVEPGVIRVEHRSRFGYVELIGGALAPGDVEDSVQPGPDPSVLGALLTRPLELVYLPCDGLPHLVGDLQGFEAGPIVLAALVAVDLPELLADGRHLLAQEVLTLGPLHPLGHVGPDAVLQLQLGQGLAGPAQHQLHPQVRIHRLQQLDLALDREVRPVTGRVGELARIGDASQHVPEAGHAAVLGDSFEHGAQLPGPLDRGRSGRLLVDRVDVHPEGGPGDGRGRPDSRALLTGDHDGRRAARKRTAASYRGDGPDPSEPTLARVRPLGAPDARHQDDPVSGSGRGRHRLAGLRGLEGEGDGHARHHHAGV